MRADTPGRAAHDVAAQLDVTARGLRAGLSLSAALAQVDRPTPRLAQALDAHRRGEPLAAALTAAAASSDGPERLAVAVLAVAALHGGPTAEALDRTAATLRERAALAEETDGHAAAGRLSATVLTFVPLAFTALSITVDDRVRQVLLATPIGWACLVIGLSLNLAGRRWMNRIVGATGAGA